MPQTQPPGFMSYYLSFLRALAAVVIAILPASIPAQELHRIPYVGGVTDNSCVVLTWLASQGTARVEYATDESMSSPIRTSPLLSSESDDNVLKFTLEPLTPAQRYYYRVIDESGRPISRTQSFKTFPRQGDDAPLTIFFGSCQQARAGDSGRVFNVAADLGGDLFVHLGDWTYPDLVDADYPRTDTSLRRAYEFRLDTSYSFARRVLATMSMAYEWDDHDAYGSNSDGTVADSIKRKVASAYRRYTPHAPLPSEIGIWHAIRAGNVEIFMLDNRTYRSPIDQAFSGNQFLPPPGHSMLAGGSFTIPGQDQVTWLMNAIRSSTARWKIISSPLPFNPAMGQMIPLALILGRRDVAERFAEECWAGYPADIDSIRSLIAQGFLANTLIISGSAHTNMYDDGTHSLLPEFVAANLDQENSGLYDSLRAYGLRIWTAGQSGSESTVGRIRIETIPRHRLVVESFSESGTRLLELVVEEKGASTLVVDASRGGDIRTILRNGRLTLLTDLEPGEGTIRLFAIDGREVASARLFLDDRGIAIWTIPLTLPPGRYVGRIERGNAALPFSLVK